MNHVEIPSPSAVEVDRYVKQWDGLDNYVQQESSLHKLFTETYPHNTDMDDILIKVCSLNQFYSTNIFDVFRVADHIRKSGIDRYLRDDDMSGVNALASVTMNGGKTKNFYSFASKYFSHHRPEIYPIYDYYVEKVLLYFYRVDKFHSFTKADLKDYRRFTETIQVFRRHYGLDKYSIKDIDRYLWQLGKEYYPRRYGIAAALQDDNISIYQ